MARHLLSGCAVCRSDVAAYQEIVALLGLAGRAALPLPATRARVRRMVRDRKE